MKKLFLFLIAVILFTATETKAEIYPETGIVSAIETQEGDFYSLSATTFSGHIFVFDTEDGDWLENDICSMIMDDCGTETVHDDIVLSARYSGYIR